MPPVTFRVVSHEPSEHRIVADEVEGRNGWLLLTDNTTDQRWSILFADVVAWHYLVGDGRLTIYTPGRIYVVTGEGHNDPYEVTNELDDLLYQMVVSR